MYIYKQGFLLALLAALTACGGGGGGDSTTTPPTTTPPPTTNPPVVVDLTASDKLADANSYDRDELLGAATELANNKYTGSRQAAAINVENSQSAMNWLFDTEETNVPDFLEGPLEDYRDPTGALNETVPCAFGGSLKITGQLNSDLQGNISFKLTNCRANRYSEILNGTAAITITSIEDNQSDVTLYYDNFEYQQEGEQSFVSGFISYKSDYNNNTGAFSNIQENYVAITTNGTSLLLESTAIVANGGNQNTFSMEGELFVEGMGKVLVSTNSLDSPPPYPSGGYITLVGDKTVTIVFESPYIKYLQDDDNDGNADYGAYFSDAFDFMQGDLSLTNVVAIAELSLPPVASSVWHNYDNIYTTTPIVVYSGEPIDPDNTVDELTVSYVWYLNDEVITGQTSNILPANIARFGDDLRVAQVVSDGPNTAEGPSTQITILDSPRSISVSNMPENVTSSDTLTFTTSVTDPDEPDFSASAAEFLVSAPAGASIDAQGVVTWQVPDSQMFSSQTYAFTFAPNGELDETAQLVDIDVEVNSSKAMPLARMGVEVPQNNRSMAIGDFDGDGTNEILSSDSQSSVFLLKNVPNNYEQLWVYPFSIELGDIVQVLAAQLDGDAALEIVVVSDNGISIIHDLESAAEVVLTTDQYIRFAQLADTNADGVVDIAYLQSSNEYFYDDTELVVKSMNALDSNLFSSSVEQAKEFLFGNVDSDSNLELVTNSGLVYDTATWDTQWTSSNEFSSGPIALGDFNDDGIDEVAGANTWGSLVIYSVVDRAQIASVDSFNNCTLIAENLDADSADELVLGDCQWGDISAFNLVGNQLEEIWSVGNEAHGAISLVSGDSDNDGELEIHWGSGVTSSGEDKLVGADIDTALGTATKKSLSQDIIQLDSFSTAGWSTVNDSDEKAVFYVLGTNSGYGGSRIVYLNLDGTFTLSSELGSSFNYNGNAITTDFNKDGVGDIFLPEVGPNGSFGAMQLSDEHIHWQADESYYSAGNVKVHDINNDGFDDAILISGNTLKIFDVYNETTLASITLSNSFIDAEAFKIGETTAIVLVDNEKTVLYTYNGTSLSEQSFVTQSCRQIVAFNFDTDVAKELLCLQNASDYQYNEQQSLVVYEIQDNTLVESQRNELNVYVSALVVDPSNDTEQTLFLAASYQTSDYLSDYERNSFIAKAGADGSIVWRSRPLIGGAKKDGLKARVTASGSVEILYSTAHMMYWIK